MRSLTTRSSRRPTAVPRWRAFGSIVARLNAGVRPMRVVLASLAAILAPAAIMIGSYVFGALQSPVADDGFLWVRVRGFSSVSLLVSAAYVVLLGLPVFILLRWRGLIRWWSCVGSGFLLGALPVAVLTWPLRYSELRTSASVDGVQTMIA